MTRSSAQIEASRLNGAQSHGPITPEGKARSAQNALKHAIRSSNAALTDLDDLETFAELRLAVSQEVRPRNAAEAMLVARMASALWRAERAEALESQFWRFLPQGVKAKQHLRLIRVFSGEQLAGRSLATIHRYQAETQNAFTRAIKALQLLRRVGEVDAPPACDQDDPACRQSPPEPIRTNEPEHPASSMSEPEKAPPLPAPAAPLVVENARANDTNEPKRDPRIDPSLGDLDFQRRALRAFDQGKAIPPVPSGWLKLPEGA